MTAAHRYQNGHSCLQGLHPLCEGVREEKLIAQTVMGEAMEVARTDSDTISNMFLSTVKGSASTFLLESRELTLDDVNCLRSKEDLP